MWAGDLSTAPLPSGCGECLRAALAALPNCLPSCDAGSSPLHLQERHVVHETVDRRRSHARLGEHLAQLGEGRVGCHSRAPVLVALGDELE